MKPAVILILFFLQLLLSCNQDDKNSNAGKDSDGKDYQISCESNVEKCGRKAAIKIEFIAVNEITSILMCCRDMERVLDSLDSFKQKLVEYAASPTNDKTTEIEFGDFAIMVSTCVKSEKPDSIYSCLTISRVNPPASGIQFRDTPSLNEFRNKLEKVFIPCCLN